MDTVLRILFRAFVCPAFVCVLTNGTWNLEMFVETQTLALETQTLALAFLCYPYSCLKFIDI